jgi:hypothetical protein
MNPVQPDDARRLSFDINPIHYLHLPQTGSGLATVVAHHACGSVLSEDETVEEPSDFLEKWGPACDPSRFGRFISGHDPLSVSEAGDVQHVVVMLRDPAQRILSGYHHDLSDCHAIMRKYNCKTAFGKTRCDGDIETEDGHYKRDPNSISPLEYAKCVENCTANMLTGRSCDHSALVDVDRAVKLVDEVGFVGLTDEWALSICLWHRRFGGRMLPSELKRLRSSFEGSTENGITKFDEHTLLGRWRPESEYAVFDTATRRFWREIDEFGVDPESCEQEAKALVHKTLVNAMSTMPVASDFDGRSRSYYPTPLEVNFDPLDPSRSYSRDAFDSSSRASTVSEGPSAAATSSDFIKPVYHQIEDVQASSYRDMNPYSTQGNHVEKSSVYPASGEPVMTIVDGPTVPFDSNSTFDAQRTPLDINQGRYIDPVYSEHSQANAVSSGYDSTIPVASNFDGRSHSDYPTTPNSADYQSPSVDFNPMNANSSQSGYAFDSSSRASIVSEGPSAAATSLDYIKPVYHQIEDVQTSSYRDMNPYSTQGNYLGSLVKNPLVYSASGETVMDGPILPFDGGER